jgi:alkylation response protein AidB-like acyl-CoA dehydrogenase
MRFDLTEEQEMIREAARRFLESEAPISGIRAAFETVDGFSRDIWRQQCELGWAALALAEQDGGLSERDLLGRNLAIIAEELGRLVGAGPFASTAIVLDALAHAEEGTEAATLIERAVSGEAILAWAFGEEGGNWTPSHFTTRVQMEPDRLHLDGRKAYVEAGAQADVFLVTALSDAGLVQVAVPVNTAGVAIRPSKSVDFVRRFAEVTFEDVCLPASALVTGPERGTAQIERQVQLALLLQCSETNGLLDRTFDFTIEYMRERVAFGRVIASFQALKHRLADLMVILQSSQATTDAALDAFDRADPDAGRLARIAKAYVAGHATDFLSDLIQLTGGIGVTWEYDLHIYGRRAALNRALFDTPERHRIAAFALARA